LLDVPRKELVKEIFIVLIAFGLAIDSFSVSITSGLTNDGKTIMLTKAIKIAFFFGFFQAIMSIIGWLAGISIVDLISDFDHWIAFSLLLFIGLRMIYESVRTDSKKIVNFSNIAVLLMLSVATSIDSLAVGLSLSFLDVLIIVPAVLTGIVTFLLSFLGVYLGDKFGTLFGRRIEIVGGLILIVIGVNIVIEHLGV
jgi:putative Mn2+ efflux pump MntP